MKFFLALAFTLLGLTVATPVFADDYYNDLTIGEPEKPTITDQQLAKGRAVATANADQLIRDPHDIVVGNPHGGITLIQFIDFLCTLSQRMDPSIQALIKANPDLRVVYKPYPLRGSLSNYAAKYTLAANKQGKYLPLHVDIMATKSTYDEKKLDELAKADGLNVVEIKSDMNNKSYQELINSTASLAQKIGIPGTPVLFFAKTTFTSDEKPELILYMLGQFDQPELQKAVDKIRSEE
ncbi:MAG: DsbA family protein [Pseudomonadota bacterium]